MCLPFPLSIKPSGYDCDESVKILTTSSTDVRLRFPRHCINHIKERKTF